MNLLHEHDIRTVVHNLFEKSVYLLLILRELYVQGVVEPWFTNFTVCFDR